MFEKLYHLYHSLNKLGFQSESFIVDFLIKIAGYDDEWRKTVEDSYSKNTKPFNDWFNGQSRLFVDFKAGVDEEIEVDEEVNDALSEHGYFITDYVGGYCQKDGRTFKIGKILQKLYNDDIKELKSKSTTPENEDSEQQREILKAEVYWKSIINQFLNSPVRRHKNKRNSLKIVYSQDPHDIARMSYERSWTSCMNLGEGSNYKHLFCEVSEGGFVAYLIDGNDVEIEDPLARIHIRRFVNEDGVSIAKPEKTVYGNDVPGFLEAVTSWVESNNQKRMSELNLPTENTYYKRKGGEWSDTYSDILAIPPKGVEGLLEWVKGNVPNTREEKWELTDNYYEDLNDVGYWDHMGVNLGPDYDGTKTFDSEIDALTFKNRLNYVGGGDWMDHLDILDKNNFENEDGDIDEEEYEKEIDRINSERFTINKVTTDSTDELRIQAFREIINSDLFENLDMNTIQELELFLNNDLYFPDKANFKIKFYSKYPELLTEEKFNNLYIYPQTEIINNIKSTHPKEYERLNQYLIKRYINSLSFDNVKKTMKVIGTYSPIYALNDLIKPSIEINTDELYSATKEYIFNTADNILNDSKKYSEFLFYTIKSLDLHKFKSDEYLIDFAKGLWEKIDRTALAGEQRFSVYAWTNIIDSIQHKRFSNSVRHKLSVFLPLIRDLLVNAEKDVKQRFDLLKPINDNPPIVRDEVSYRLSVLGDLIKDIEYFSKPKKEELS